MPILRSPRAFSHPHLRCQAMFTWLRLRLPARIPMRYHRTQTTNSQKGKLVGPHRSTSSSVLRNLHRPFASVSDWYSLSQSRRPYVTQLCLTPLIYCLGDFSAQAIGDDDFDYHRSLRSIIIGLVIAIPSREWFLFLGRRFNYNSSSLSLGAKVAANQIFYTPMFNIYFFAFHGLLAGEGIWGAIERVKNTVPTSIPRSVLYWPLVTAFNFSYVKPQSRSIATSFFAVFWQSYLSWLNSHAGGEKVKDTCNSWPAGLNPVEDLDREMLMFDVN